VQRSVPDPLVAEAGGDDVSIVGGDRVRGEVFGHARSRFMSNDQIEEFAGALVEVPDDGSVVLVVLRTMVQEPVQNEGRNSALVPAPAGVMCEGERRCGGVHGFVPQG